MACDDCDHNAPTLCRDCASEGAAQFAKDWLDAQKYKPSPPSKEAVEFAELLIEELGKWA
jgi:hypothetical protein